MTKSKGVGRGGVRRGAGRRPDVAKVDWDAVGRAYFSGTATVDDICASFGLGYGDLLAYAANRKWCRPSPKPHPDDIGELGSALAFAMFSVKTANRIRCFVAAMAKLETNVSEIADVLQVSTSALRAEFPKELADVRD
jgi:hypothetical protein